MNISKTSTMPMDHNHDELQERQLIEQFNKQCREAIAYARRKHPKFAEDVTYRESPDLKSDAVAIKKYIQMNPTIEYVLMAEVYEFLYALAEGDMKHAQEEASHVYAVMWRTLTATVTF